MAFDYQAARKEGATDDQIINYLTQTRKFDVDGALKAGASKDDVLKYLAATRVVNTQEEKPTDTRSGLEKTSDRLNSVFGGKQLGNAIGTSVAALGRLVKGDVKGFQDIAKENRSNDTVKKVAGDTANIVATTAGMMGVGTTGTIAKKALTSSGIGAVTFAGKEATEGGDLTDIIKSGAVGAGVGAGTSLALSGVGEIAKQFKNLPERLIRSATGQSKKEILAGKSLDKYILENKKVGTADGLIKQSKDIQTRLNTIIDNNLKSISVTKTKVTTSSILDRITNDINSSGGEITKQEVKTILEKLAPQSKGLLKKPSMSLVTANKLRQSIDRTLGDKGFLVSELPFNKEILRTFTNTLREEVKTKAPQGTRAAFNSLSNEIRLADALSTKIAQGSRNQIISFGDLIGGGLGGAVGGVPGAIAGAATRRVIQSTPFLTGSAVAIDQVNKKLMPTLSKLSPATQTEILNIIGEIFSQDRDQAKY
jgi:hypothetical protein